MTTPIEKSREYIEFRRAFDDDARARRERAFTERALARAACPRKRSLLKALLEKGYSLHDFSEGKKGWSNK